MVFLDVLADRIFVGKGDAAEVKSIVQKFDEGNTPDLRRYSKYVVFRREAHCVYWNPFVFGFVFSQHLFLQHISPSLLLFLCIFFLPYPCVSFLSPAFFHSCFLSTIPFLFLKLAHERRILLTSCYACSKLSIADALVQFFKELPTPIISRKYEDLLLATVTGTALDGWMDGCVWMHAMYVCIMYSWLELFEGLSAFRLLLFLVLMVNVL